MAEWSDEEFLSYVETHSETERHLFSREHANRLLRLAGRPGQELPTFIAINKWTARELVGFARERLAT